MFISAEGGLLSPSAIIQIPPALILLMFSKNLMAFAVVLSGLCCYGSEIPAEPEVHLQVPATKGQFQQLTIDAGDPSLKDDRLWVQVSGASGSLVNVGGVSQASPIEVVSVTDNGELIAFNHKKGINRRGCPYSTADFELPAGTCMLCISASSGNFAGNIKIVGGLSKDAASVVRPVPISFSNEVESEEIRKPFSIDASWLIVIISCVFIIALVVVCILIKAKRVAVLELHCSDAPNHVVRVYLHQLRHKNGFTVGRSASNDLVLKHSSVSSTHARLSLDPSGKFLVCDLKSTNGTWLNKSRLEPHKPVPLSSGCTLNCAKVSIKIVRL